MEIRKLCSFVEELRREAGRPADPPLRKAAVVAVIANPFAGRWVEDLQPLTEASGDIGRTIAEMAARALAPYAVESLGKAAVVGLRGEQEHAVAMLTTVFGNAMRAPAGGGKAWISSLTKRAGPGVTVDVPLAHKDALYVRSHYDGMTLTLHDAPLEDEIALICCYANRGRLNDRVGGLRKEQVEGRDGLV